MAAAIYNKLTNTSDAFSAGTFVGSESEPEGIVIETRFQKPDFFELMEADGMYIRKNKTTELTPEMIDKADIVVSMAEEPYIPDFLKNNKKVVFWDVENPSIATREISQKTITQIKKLIEDLIKKN